MKYEYQLTVRLPETVAEKLKAKALTSKRSMNAEIVQILSQSVGDSSEDNIEYKLKGIIANAESVLSNIKK